MDIFWERYISPRNLHCFQHCPSNMHRSVIYSSISKPHNFRLKEPSGLHKSLISKCIPTLPYYSCSPHEFQSKSVDVVGRRRGIFQARDQSLSVHLPALHSLGHLHLCLAHFPTTPTRHSNQHQTSQGSPT